MTSIARGLYETSNVLKSGRLAFQGDQPDPGSGLLLLPWVSQGLGCPLPGRDAVHAEAIWKSSLIAGRDLSVPKTGLLSNTPRRWCPRDTRADRAKAVERGSQVESRKEEGTRRAALVAVIPFPGWLVP